MKKEVLALSLAALVLLGAGCENSARSTEREKAGDDSAFNMTTPGYGAEPLLGSSDDAGIVSDDDSETVEKSGDLDLDKSDDGNEGEDARAESSKSTGTDESEAGSQVAVKTFTITSGNFTFAPSTLKVKKGDKVKLILKNVEGFHDLKIDEFKVATTRIKDVGTAEVEFIANKIGVFEYYCSVGTHRQMGMKGLLTVTE